MSKDTAININTMTDTLNSLHDELEKRIQGIQADLSRGRSQDSQEQAQETENDEVLHALATQACCKNHVLTFLRKNSLQVGTTICGNNVYIRLI